MRKNKEVKDMPVKEMHEKKILSFSILLNFKLVILKMEINKLLTI